MQGREGLRRRRHCQKSRAGQREKQILNVSFHGFLWLLSEAVKSLRDARGEVGDGFHRAVAGYAGQTLPVRRRQGIDVLRRVSFSRFGLKREHEIIANFGRGVNNRRRLNPEAALDGKPRAARHGGERLGDGAAQLKPRAAAERRAATGNHTARDGESRAALGKDAG